VTTSTSHRSLRELPKAHLHLHLEGAMRSDTLQALSDRYDVSVPRIGDRLGNFAAFQELYLAARGVGRLVA
jgi:adenosine deaminase